MRLDKYLSHSGAGSRKEVKDFITKGLVSVNGKIILSPKHEVKEEDLVELDGLVKTYQEYVYYMLNKPKDTISATQDRRLTVLDCIKKEDQRVGLFPVGRLDKDTTGLLLLTDDGALAHRLLSPKSRIPKSYLARLRKDLKEEDTLRFQKGFFLEKEEMLTLPAQLEILEKRLAKVTIMEGKYHQVKRMFAMCDNEVLELKRLTMGKLSLDESLLEGEYRPLTPKELEDLLI